VALSCSASPDDIHNSVQHFADFKQFSCAANRVIKLLLGN
jgi:hypothetical protein